MEIHYEFTLEDLKALLGWYQGPELARRQRLHRWAGSAWLALMGASLAIGLEAPLPAWLAVAAVPALFWWRYPEEIRRRAERHAASQLRQADREGRLGACSLSITPQGLRLRSPGADRSWGWERVQQVIATETLVLVLTGREDLVAVPRRALPPDVAPTDLFVRVRSRVA
ncbi:YcxB family protein [Aggregicoccus sp. 17bor-14]|uniref:YcxB family protein n=1 Tax=Myxococcaceae TaxID=31 RepID=UPI00129C9C4F|nr:MULTISPECIES: YcxB family protein [Myxococcaceae]MBF5040945.1 YcxB family protein [Simulacricoccus sp. 17bor-14]MRI86733.1 YcxB family protein [Aggregicoccus sp. 17bor-14]